MPDNIAENPLPITINDHLYKDEELITEIYRNAQELSHYQMGYTDENVPFVMIFGDLNPDPKYPDHGLYKYALGMRAPISTIIQDGHIETDRRIMVGWQGRINQR